MRLNKEERVFLTKKFIELRNVTLVRRAWRTEYKNQSVPDSQTILGTVARFEQTGSIASLPPIPAAPSEKRESAKNQLKIMISEDPTLSIRKASVALDISYALTRDILLDDLKLKPYKYQETHELQPQDYQKRVDFAQWLLRLPENTHEYMIFSDEAYFYLTESVNKQNNRMWLESRPTDWIEKPLHDKKVLVWCAISSRKIYGPYYFEESVNQYNYLEMLTNFFWEKHYRTSNYNSYYFQQDGATPHTANSVQTWLTSRFGDKFIDKKQWPPRSPDLNPCDFFLWGYLKARVYKPLPKTLDDLKANIEKEIKNIDQSILKSTFSNFRKRVDLVIASNGGHIENK